MRALTSVAVTILVLLAGCIGATNSADPAETAGDAVDERMVSEDHSFETDVSVSVRATENVHGVGWSLEAPPGVQEIDMTLSWERDANSFGLRVDGPDGEDRHDPPDDLQATSLEASVEDPTAGTYGFDLVRPAGATVPDTVELDVTVVRAATAGASSTNLRVYQDGGDWVAEMSYSAAGPAEDEMTAEVDVANGRIEAETAGDQAEVGVTAWARASTRDRAIDRVQEIDVTVGVEEERIVGRASLPDEDWNNRGAHASVTTPSRLSGTLDTSNGPIDLVDLDGGDLTADTSNGPIEATGTFQGPLVLDTSNGRIGGEVTLHGDAQLDTSNGPIDVELTPEAPLTLEADTSNGPIDLGLTERSDVAYELGVSTSNGEITEDMDEAELRGDEDQATLVTRDGDGRAIQVDGTVDTSNGPVHFEGR